MDALVQGQTLLVVDLLISSVLDQGQPVHDIATQQELPVVAFQLAVAVGQRLSLPSERRVRWQIRVAQLFMPTVALFRTDRPQQHGARVRSSAVICERCHDNISICSDGLVVIPVACVVELLSLAEVVALNQMLIALRHLRGSLQLSRKAIS